MGILAHGGAGSGRISKMADSVMNGVIKKASDLLDEGQGAVDVACHAIMMLEDSAEFNAGTGSCLTREKTIEMDAGIMDGRTMQCGGIGAIKNIKNPIKAAKNVMYGSDHSLIVGDEALKFSLSAGIKKYDMVPTGEQLGKLESLTAGKFGTVGAVVIDKRGNIAAGVSTGGMWNKIPGRVGDSAIVGAGYYAKNGVGGAAATGNGDILMKSCISKITCDMLKTKDSQSAADSAISELGLLDGGKGGVITVDKNGDIGASYNTEIIHHAYRFENV